MKTLLKWNFLFVLFIMCSTPLFIGCGGDDDGEADPDNPGEITYIGWKEIGGNKATFGFKQSVGGVKWSGIITLSFDGSGDNAKCTKCVVEETWPEERFAQASEAEHKNEEGVKNVKRSGKKVTYDLEDGFVGTIRSELKALVAAAFPSN